MKRAGGEIGGCTSSVALFGRGRAHGATRVRSLPSLSSREKVPRYVSPAPHGWRRPRGGWTLPEIMVSLAIFSLVTAALISGQVFGWRLLELSQVRLSLHEEARLATARLEEEIRAAGLVRVGQGSASSFTEAAPNARQQGNALQLHTAADTNRFVRYFVDPEGRLKRFSNKVETVMAAPHAITNQPVFTVEDPWGNVLTNQPNHRVIGMAFQFDYGASNAVLPGHRFELRARTSRRALQ